MEKIIPAPLLFETDFNYSPDIFDQFVVLNTQPVRVLRTITSSLQAIAGQQPMCEDKIAFVEQQK